MVKYNKHFLLKRLSFIKYRKNCKKDQMLLEGGLEERLLTETPGIFNGSKNLPEFHLEELATLRTAECRSDL